MSQSPRLSPIVSPSPRISGSAASRSLRYEPLEQRIALDGAGLLGQYFHNADLTGLAYERVEAVNHPWGTAAPAPGVDPETFSVRWIGQLEAEFSETYTIRTISDDGVRLWIDGQLVIDNWTVHSAVVDTGQLAMQAGQRYDVRLEYFENVGSSQIRLQWTSPSQALEYIPAANLYEPATGLRGEYSGGGGEVVRIDPALDFQWAGQPIAGVPADGFTASWTGYVRSTTSEPYVFRTVSDEGVRVWVNDQLIIDHWTPHESATAEGAITLEAGKWYDLRVEHFDEAGDAEVQLLWSSAGTTGSGQFEIVPAEHLRAGQRASLTFTNPLGWGADPFVIRWQDSYLHIRSTGGSIYIDQAERLEDIHRDNPASTSVRAWTPPPGTSYSTMVWAPELHQIDGKWYIYVAAAANNDNSTHRMYVLERDHPNPMGSYIFKGQLAPATDRWAIDGTALQWEGQLYFIWSGWPGFTNGQQNLYIAEMSDPWTISGDRTVLSTPTYSWERHGLAINEGPQILVNDGQLHIVYSASGYWRHEYALGRLTYRGTGPLTSAASWSKATNPVFQQAGEIVGTGHASFTTSPDGSESWIVYHAHHDANNWQDDRDILIQPFTYNADGTPNFGSPIPKSTPIGVPSGTPDANYVAAAGDYDASGGIGGEDLQVFAAQYGQAMPTGASADGGGDGIVAGDDFLLWQRARGGAVVVAATSSAEFVAAPLAAVERVESTVDADAEVAASPGPASAFAATRAWFAAPVFELRSSAAVFVGDHGRIAIRGEFLRGRDRAFEDWAVQSTHGATSLGTSTIRPVEGSQIGLRASVEGAFADEEFEWFLTARIQKHSGPLPLTGRVREG